MTSNILTFKAIAGFVCEAEEMCSLNNRSNQGLTQYARHLETVPVVNDGVIDMHIDAFRSFCSANRELIANGALHTSRARLVQFSEDLDFDAVKLLEDLDNNFVYKHLASIASMV